MSVVMPVLNGERVIGQQLEALSRQDFRGEWELIIADNGSTDQSVVIAQRYQDRIVGLRIVDASARRGASFAYNFGADAARGRFLTFCDADDEVSDTWVREMAAALVDHDFVAGRCLQDGLNPPWLARQRDLPQHQGLQTGLGRIAVPHAGSGNMGVRRRVFLQAGGFRSDIAVFGDTDLCWRLQRAGVALHFAPEAVVQVRFRNRLRDAYRQGRSYGAAEQQLMAIHDPAGHGTSLIRECVANLVLPWPRVLTSLVAVRNRGDLHSWAWSNGWRMGRSAGWRATLRRPSRAEGS